MKQLASVVRSTKTKPMKHGTGSGGLIFARLQLLGAALLFSTGGAAIKATTLNAWQVAGFRSAIAAMILWGLFRKQAMKLQPLLLATAATYAATLILFVLANKWTTSAHAIFLQDTAPLYLLLLGPWLLGERLRARDWPFVALVVTGLSLFFLAQQQPLRTAPRPFEGNLVALASGVTWALTLAGIRWFESRSQPGAGMGTVVWGNTLACAIALPFCFPVQGRLADWWVLGYLGVFQIGLAYVLLTRGMRRVGALEASLLLLAEPALNPVWSWWAHGERPAGLALLGGGVILASTAWRALQKG